MGKPKQLESAQGWCIIHRASTSEETDGHLVSPQSYEYWQTLLEAVQVRNHAPENVEDSSL